MVPSHLLSCASLALLSEHSLLVIGLLFLVIVTVPDCGLIVSAVLYQVGAALWTIVIRPRSGLYVVSVATGPPTWTQQLSCTKLALLSGRSLFVVGLFFIVIVTSRLWPCVCCPVPSWRCSLDASYSTSFWSSRGQCWYRSIDAVLVSTVPYHAGAALWTLAIRRRPSLHVVSVVTVPDCGFVSAVL